MYNLATLPGGPDSGYVSHSSGGGYPKLQVKFSNRKIYSFSIKKEI